MTKPKHVWMVRAGNDNTLADKVEGNSAVAIGWMEMRDLTQLRSRVDFKQRYMEAYPEDSDQRAAVNASQVYRFTREIAIGDYVLTYDKASRELLVGLIEGSYEFKPHLFSEDYPHVRRVSWLKRISRDAFSRPARDSLGSTLTVFSADKHLSEIHQLVTASAAEAPLDVQLEEVPPFYQEVKAQADELIADLVSRLDPYDFQNLVAGVLRAMGFQAISSSPGRDRGIDIVAHPDPLGFERPRIKVQVKHRKGGAVSGPEMRSFLGTLREGDSGLYVSTGDYTSDARREADRSRDSVTLLDRDGFIRLLLEYYEALESEHKAQVPLRRIWVPME